jgi:hypothetical protein
MAGAAIYLLYFLVENNYMALFTVTLMYGVTPIVCGALGLSLWVCVSGCKKEALVDIEHAASNIDEKTPLQ